MVNQFTNLRGISKKRGQVSYISTDTTLKNLKFPICAGGYLSPKNGDKHLIGSSYSKSNSTELIQAEHEENLEKINIIYNQNIELKGGRVGFRTVTRDRLPLAGVIDGIHVNVGHGSKGSTSAPLCSEYIADLIDGTVLPVDSFVAKALKPDRFKIRN
jgi:tRNA 5-methylaminomethyl-2-thiouridine biosynthesis bifunctional protein